VVAAVTEQIGHALGPHVESLHQPGRGSSWARKALLDAIGVPPAGLLVLQLQLAGAEALESRVQGSAG